MENAQAQHVRQEQLTALIYRSRVGFALRGLPLQVYEQLYRDCFRGQNAIVEQGKRGPLLKWTYSQPPSVISSYLLPNGEFDCSSFAGGFFPVVQEWLWQHRIEHHEHWDVKLPKLVRDHSVPLEDQPDANLLELIEERHHCWARYNLSAVDPAQLIAQVGDGMIKERIDTGCPLREQPKIGVVCKTREQCERLHERLREYCDVPVFRGWGRGTEVVPQDGGVVNGTHRDAVWMCHQMDLLIVLQPQHFLANGSISPPIDSVANHGKCRLLGLLPTNEKIRPQVFMQRVALFGVDEITLERHGVVDDSPPEACFVPYRGGVDRKRLGEHGDVARETWFHRKRNLFVRDLARTLATGTSDAIEKRLGVIPDALAVRHRPKITILVDSVDHLAEFRLLFKQEEAEIHTGPQACLDGLSKGKQDLLKEPPYDLAAVMASMEEPYEHPYLPPEKPKPRPKHHEPRITICTTTAFEPVRHQGVVIRADGLPSVPQELAKTFSFNDKRRLKLLVDIDDRRSKLHRQATRMRRNSYTRHGLRFPGEGNSALDRFQRLREAYTER